MSQYWRLVMALFKHQAPSEKHKPWQLQPLAKAKK